MINTDNYNPDVLTCLANLSNDEVFTPPKLANEMLDLLPQDLFSNSTTTFLDPVCKSGVFLREIAKRLIVGLEKEFPDLQQRLDHIFSKQLFGIAITELTGLLSRRSVYCTKTANNEYSVCNLFNDEQGNIIYQRIEHTWKNGKCIYCGASQENYERGDELETHAYQFIHCEKPEEIFDMKFDVIIGNPPYQLSDGGYGTSSSPIYQNFVLQAKKLNPRYLSMIIPARWFSGGKYLDEFRKEMLNDKRIRVISDFPDATDVFPGVQIKGGVCFFLWKRDEKGKCKIISNKKNGVISVSERELLESGAETFIRYNEAIPILRKVLQNNFSSIKHQISARKPFGLPTNYKGHKEKRPSDLKIYQNGGFGFIDKEELTSGSKYIGKWKVFIPPLGSGSDSFPHPILGRPFIGEPFSVCTETYIIAGVFNTKEEAENLRDYIVTKFFRFMVLLNKPTQHATSKVYQFVPLQNFNEKWNDDKLFKKYGLNDEDIKFIDSVIRPMEVDSE